MPYAICNSQYTVDPVGKNNPDDFVEIATGEVTRVRPGDPLVVSGKVAELSEIDANEVIVCTCGRMFWDKAHPHFTMAGKEHELYNLRERLGKLEPGTEAHVLCEAQVASLQGDIAAAKKTHRPASTLGAVAKAEVKTVAKANANRERKAKARAKADASKE